MMNITKHMNAAVDEIAARAMAKRESIKIVFGTIYEEDKLPWTVRIGMRDGKVKRSGFEAAYGYGATIEGAADEAILDIAKHEAIGFVLSEPAT